MNRLCHKYGLYVGNSYVGSLLVQGLVTDSLAQLFPIHITAPQF
jgi:hypothetical protein